METFLSSVLPPPLGKAPSGKGLPRRRLWLGLALVSVLSGLCLWGLSYYERMLAAEARSHVALHAEVHARALSEAIASRLAMLRGLSAFVEAELDGGQGTAQHLNRHFQAFVSPLLGAEPGIRNFSIAPGGVQRWVYPLAGNEKVIGHDLLRDPRPEVAESVRRAMASADIVVTKPYQLRQGGLGIVARMAVRQGGAVWGVSAMVLDIPPLLEAAGLEAGRGPLKSCLVDQDGKVFAGDEAVLGQTPVLSTVQLPGVTWQLAAVPQDGWDQVMREELWRMRLAGWSLTGVLLLVVMALVHREARAALEASEQRFRDLAGVSADWFWELDAHLRVTHYSQRFVREPDAPGWVEGRQFADLAREHMLGGEELGRLLAERRAFRNLRIVWLGPENRQIHLDVSGLPLHDEDGRFMGWRGTGRDANAEMAALAQLQAATEARAAAEAESRAKSAFLAKMSHELRTPLNAILGFADMIVSGVYGEVQPTRYREYAEHIHSSGHHLLQVISDLLDLSLIEAGRMEIKPAPVELDQLVHELATLAGPLAARRRNHFDFSVEGTGPLVMDATRVRQVLLNLLGNACKFTSDGTVRLTARSGDGTVVFRVEDTGIGIAPNEMQNLFREFSQCEAGRAQVGQGAGLGLSITRRLCHLMGGDVVAHSTPGRGSCFTVILPAVCPVV